MEIITSLDNKRSPSKTYATWMDIKTLCTNKNHPRYQSTAKCGINLCDEWLNSFENFLRDMGEKPPGYRFKRLDKDGDFKPGNCIWFPINKKGER